MTGPKIGRYTPRNPAPLLTALIIPICIVSTCTMSNLFDHVKFYPVSLYHVNFCPVNLYLVSLQRMLFFVKIRNITDYIFTGWRESPKVTSSGETTLLAMYAVCCVYGYYYAVCAPLRQHQLFVRTGTCRITQLASNQHFRLEDWLSL